MAGGAPLGQVRGREDVVRLLLPGGLRHGRGHVLHPFDEVPGVVRVVREDRDPPGVRRREPELRRSLPGAAEDDVAGA